MSGPCVFCDIVEGKEPATIVAGWDDSLAIIPLNPVVEGHVIVLPKHHVADACEIPIVTGITMISACYLAQQHESVNLITSVGEPATQTIGHLHIHVVPRTPNDGLHLPWRAHD